MPARLRPLHDALLSLRTPEEAARFLVDLCTSAELRAFEDRWHVAQLLAAGELSYREVAAQAHASTTTVVRVAKFLNDSPEQGYRLVIDRLANAK